MVCHTVIILNFKNVKRLSPLTLILILNVCFSLICDDYGYRCVGINENLDPKAQRPFLWAAPQSTLWGTSILRLCCSHQTMKRSGHWAFSLHIGIFGLLSDVVSHHLSHQCQQKLLCDFNLWEENFIWLTYQWDANLVHIPYNVPPSQYETSLWVRWTEILRDGAMHSAGNTWFLESPRALFP